MPNLKEVKNRIQSVISTQQITKAMKMVAAAKLRRAQDKIIQMRPYANRLNEVLQNLTRGSGVQELNIYAEERSEDKILLIPITSDRGLCGAFNSNVAKLTTRRIEEKYKSQFNHGDVAIMPLGKKGYDHFRKRGYTILDEHFKMFSDLSFAMAGNVALSVMKKYRSEEFDKVEIIYNEFKNVATQILRVEQFLPVVDSGEETEPIEYIYEPSQERIIKEMIPNSLKAQLYKALLESNAAEHGARMTAMDQATDNAGELLGELKLKYNQTRQAAITKELLEIVSGAEALNK